MIIKCTEWFPGEEHMITAAVPSLEKRWPEGNERDLQNQRWPEGADRDLMFAVTSSTRTRMHDMSLKQISKYKTKKKNSNCWAVNQQNLLPKSGLHCCGCKKITWVQREYKYLEETSLDGYYIDRNHNQEIPMLKIAWGWESSSREGAYLHILIPLLTLALTNCLWSSLGTKCRAGWTLGLTQYVPSYVPITLFILRST